MKTFIHSPVSPLLVDIASYNQFHLAITYQGTNYRMSSTTWSSLNGKRKKIFLLTTTALGGKGQQTSVWGLCPSFSSIVRKKTFFFSRNLPTGQCPVTKYLKNFNSSFFNRISFLAGFEKTCAFWW